MLKKKGGQHRVLSTRTCAKTGFVVYIHHKYNPNNPVVILRFAILTSDSADRGRSIIRVTVNTEISKKKQCMST